MVCHSDKYHCYSTRATAFYDYLQFKPLSVVQLSDLSFFIIFDQSQFYVSLTLDKYIGMNNGHHYHEWNFCNKVESTQSMENIQTINYFLLLPQKMVKHDVLFQNHYTLINDKWEEICKDGSFSLPSLPFAPI